MTNHQKGYNMDRKTKTMLIGIIAGALLGAVVAWTVNDAEEDGETGLAALGPSDYFQLGIGILTLARKFGTMLK